VLIRRIDTLKTNCNMYSASSTVQKTTVPVESRAIPTLHHIGFVVSSIREELEGFTSSVGATWNGEIFDDPLQQVRVTFLQPASAAEAAIELVEPTVGSSPVSRFLERGGGLHHLCYEVDDLEAALKLARTLGGLVVKQPLPAVAFKGRRIAWVVTRNRLVIEYLERGRLS
jgi:methylmalonyl-CoA/ethylmalonyl-CoA epimerase